MIEQPPIRGLLPFMMRGLQGTVYTFPVPLHVGHVPYTSSVWVTASWWTAWPSMQWKRCIIPFGDGTLLDWAMPLEGGESPMDFWTALLRLAGALTSLVASVLKLHSEVKRDERSEKEEGR